MTPMKRFSLMLFMTLVTIFIPPVLTHSAITYCVDGSAPEFIFSDQVLDYVDNAAAKLGVEGSYLMAIMDWQSGFRLQASSDDNLYFGLFKISARDAEDKFGVYPDDLFLYDVFEQIDLFVQFVQGNFPTENPSLENLYLALVHPEAINKSSDFVLFTKKSYKFREGLDSDSDGTVTKEEAVEGVMEKYAANAGKCAPEQSPPPPIPDSTEPPSTENQTPSDSLKCDVDYVLVPNARNDEKLNVYKNASLKGEVIEFFPINTTLKVICSTQGDGDLVENYSVGYQDVGILSMGEIFYGVCAGQEVGFVYSWEIPGVEVSVIDCAIIKAKKLLEMVNVFP